MNISVPDSLKSWAESRVVDGDYSSTSDYVRDLMRRDRVHAERMAIFRQAIDEGYASGFEATTPRKVIDEILSEDIEAELRG